MTTNRCSNPKPHPDPDPGPNPNPDPDPNPNQARDAYRSYLHAYNSHSLKDVYDVHGLNLLSVAKSFGFTAPPKVTLNLKPNAKEGERRKSQGSKGAGFTKDNPYGIGKKQQAADDRRQFSR